MNNTIQAVADTADTSQDKVFLISDEATSETSEDSNSDILEATESDEQVRVNEVIETVAGLCCRHVLSSMLKQGTLCDETASVKRLDELFGFLDDLNKLCTTSESLEPLHGTSPTAMFADECIVQIEQRLKSISEMMQSALLTRNQRKYFTCLHDELSVKLAAQATGDSNMWAYANLVRAAADACKEALAAMLIALRGGEEIVRRRR